MRGYKTKEEMMREASAEQNFVHQRTKKQSKKTLNVVLYIALVLILGVCAIIGYNHKTFEHHSDDYEYEGSASVATYSVTADTLVADTEYCYSSTDTTIYDDEGGIEKGGAPLSTGEIEDGKGGYDDNAEGYFNMHADKYVTDNQDVYFEGNFSDSKGTYPIMLKFELDDNLYAGTCYYHNIEYGTKLKMRVRFTEEEMIIRGNADGCDFIMKFTPTDDGCWAGTAQNGSHHLKASIIPVNR